jgi:HEAT repeat protein
MEKARKESIDIPDIPRIEGIKKMRDIFGRRAFEYLVINLWDENKWVRIAAADSLAELKDIRANHFLVLFINDSDKDVRSTITSSIGKIMDENITETIGSDHGFLRKAV